MSTTRYSPLCLVCCVSLACADGGPHANDRQALGRDGKSLELVYISPDPLGVNPFLIMGQEGIEAVGHRLGAETRVLESVDPTTREENVQAAIDAGADLIVVLGFEFSDILARLAPQTPDVEFLIVDQCLDDPPPNVTCAVFREFEASFLVGAMAAALSESGRVGIVGAADIPFLHRYTDGFAAGAGHLKPSVKVSVRWVGGESPFADPVRAKEQALTLYGSGVDVLFAAAAAGNFGIFEAAQESGRSVFGLDVDQCAAAPGHVIDNLMKRVDIVIEEAVQEILAGRGHRLLVYGLESGGLDLVALSDQLPEESLCTIIDYPQVIDLVRELRDQVVAGEVGIEDPMGLL